MAGGLSDVAALAVGGQQHGMVCLDAQGGVVRDALLWNDVRSADAAAELITDLGDGDEAAAGGHGPTPWDWSRWPPSPRPSSAGWPTPNRTTPTDGGGLPAPRLAHLAAVRRPRPRHPGHRPRRRERHRLLVRAHRRVPGRPAGTRLRGVRPPFPGSPGRPSPSASSPARRRCSVRAPATTRRLRSRWQRARGTSSSRSAPPGSSPDHDDGGRRCHRDSGRVRRRDGHHLPLVATLNAARVLDAAATLLGVDHAMLSDLALSAPSGAGGLVLVPYLEGERTPTCPGRRGAVHGLTLRTSTPAYWARPPWRACCAGWPTESRRWSPRGVRRSVLLIGGGAASPAVQQLAPGIFGRPILVPPPGEYVADGAARQAAWVLAGTGAPPSWAQPGLRTFEAPAAPVCGSDTRRCAGAPTVSSRRRPPDDPGDVGVGLHGCGARLDRRPRGAPESPAPAPEERASSPRPGTRTTRRDRRRHPDWSTRPPARPRTGARAGRLCPGSLSAPGRHRPRWRLKSS